MKVLKKILIYLAFIIGIVVVAALICFAVMFFVPGTSILGYEYVLYNDKTTTEYATTDPLVSGVQALEIITEATDIYVIPNAGSNMLKVYHEQGLSGYAKSINADLNIEIKTKNTSFEESLTTYKTFSINIDEPNGWIAKSRANIYVYVPSTLSLNTIYARSTSGNVHYISENTIEVKDEETKEVTEVSATLRCTNLYLKTGEYGKLDIDNKYDISNYYLKTGHGNAQFTNVQSISANTIKFETLTGLLNVTNTAKDATLNLTNKLEIESYDDYTGPRININKLNGNLVVNANNGSYTINTIGSFGMPKTVAMTLNQAYINFGTVYAHVSILGEGSDVENNITITRLDYDLKTNAIECGNGNTTIHNLNGNVSVDSTSGNINIKNATIESNIYTYSTSGSVNVKYVASEADNEATKLTILTRTGNVNLENISCSLELQVLSNSANSKVNIVFTSIATVDNIINARNRKVNITLKGDGPEFQHRIVSTKAVIKADDVPGGEVSTEYDADNSINDDYLLKYEQYKDYNYGYRIGYTKKIRTQQEILDGVPPSHYESRDYDLTGKLLITCSGATLKSTLV